MPRSLARPLSPVWALVGALGVGSPAFAQTAPNGEPEVAGACSGADQVCMITVGVTCPNPWSYALAMNANTAAIPTFSSAVEAAFLVWGTQPSSAAIDGVANAAVACSGLVTQRRAVDNQPTAAVIGDGLNSIGVNVTDNGGVQYCDYLNLGGCGAGAGTSVAVGLAVSESNGTEVSECDVYYNSVDFTFADSLAGPLGDNIDIETVANQEVGHCFGLHHFLADDQAVMYPYVSPGQTRPTLQPHDINNICALFPVAGAFGGSCSAAAGCDGGLTCIAEATASYCSSPCTPPASGQPDPCATGFHCGAIPAGGNFCLVGPPTSGIQLGAPCTDVSACNSAGSNGGECVPAMVVIDGGLVSSGFPNGYCVSRCRLQPDGGIGPGDCPAGGWCVPNPGGESGSGACFKGCGGFYPPRSVCGRSDGYTCQPLFADTSGAGNPRYGDFICYPGCQSDADCAKQGGNLACRTADRSCVQAGGNAAAKPGDPCSSDQQCPLGGTCFTAAQGFPDGYCTVGYCGGDPEDLCGAAGDCVILDASDNLGQCYASCDLATKTGCRANYGCVSDGALTPKGICLPSPSTASSTSGGHGTSDSGSSGGSSAGPGSSGGNSGAGSSGGASSGAGNGAGATGQNRTGGATGASDGSATSGLSATASTGGEGLTAGSNGCQTGGGVANWPLALLGGGLRRRRRQAPRQAQTVAR